MNHSMRYSYLPNTSLKTVIKWAVDKLNNSVDFVL